MNPEILKELIMQAMTTTPTGNGVLSVSTKMVTDAQGNQQLEVTPVVGDAYMSPSSCEVIAGAIATAIVEWLTNYVIVEIPKATAGAVTLYGTLIKGVGR